MQYMVTSFPDEQGISLTYGLENWLNNLSDTGWTIVSVFHRQISSFSYEFIVVCSRSK